MYELSVDGLGEHVELERVCVQVPEECAVVLEK
jgi:hypothetical protein